MKFQKVGLSPLFDFAEAGYTVGMKPGEQMKSFEELRQKLRGGAQSAPAMPGTMVSSIRAESKTSATVADLSAGHALPVEAAPATIEALIGDAFSGTSPRAAEQVALSLENLLARYEQYLGRLDESSAKGNFQRTLVHEGFRSWVDIHRTRVKNSATFLRMLAQGGVTPYEEVLASQRSAFLEAKANLEKDIERARGYLVKDEPSLQKTMSIVDPHATLHVPQEVVPAEISPPHREVVAPEPVPTLSLLTPAESVSPEVIVAPVAPVVVPEMVAPRDVAPVMPDTITEVAPEIPTVTEVATEMPVVAEGVAEISATPEATLEVLPVAAVIPEIPVDTPAVVPGAIAETSVPPKAAPEIPAGPEDAPYDAMKAEWHGFRMDFESKESVCQEAIRTELDAQAKSWNPLKSVPYLMRKALGLDQKLSAEHERKKAEATAAAILYRDSSRALATAKRDMLAQKFAGLDAVDRDAKINKIIAKHDILLGRKIATNRAQAQFDAMRAAPSLVEHPRMQKAMKILAEKKYVVMATTVGIAALTGGIAPVLTAMAAGGLMREGAGGYIKKLLDNAAERAKVYAGATVRSERAGISTYAEMFQAAEKALESEAMAKKHTSYTNLVAAGAAMVAGGATSHFVSGAEIPQVAAPVSGHVVEMPAVPSPLDVPMAPAAPFTADVAPIAPPTEMYTVQPNDTLWNIFKGHLPSGVPAPTDADTMNFRNYLAQNPAELDKLGIHTGSPDIIRPGIDSIDIQKLNDAYTQFTGTPHVEAPAAPALEVPEATSVVPEATPVVPEVPIAPEVPEVPVIPEVVAPTALDLAIEKTVQAIETFNVKKAGFLGLFAVNELQTTSGAVYAAMKDRTLDDIAKIYQDPKFRATVFPEGVSQESLSRWAAWIQEHNAHTPAYADLTLADYVAKVHQPA